jgi:hypothetical protein
MTYAFKIRNYKIVDQIDHPQRNALGKTVEIATSILKNTLLATKYYNLNVLT